ncbi:hypothetical protein MYX75_07735 [Acidobacteria bacterium AH-259-A15]|nr:hypothetical protein [Acidobacteria bacterium AH-259-A15]
MPRTRATEISKNSGEEKPVGSPEPDRAKNVILFLGDGIFAADHSYDLSFPGAGPRVQEILECVMVGGGHTEEEVPVTAQGPGTAKVKGMFPNTQLFHIMKETYG